MYFTMAGTENSCKSVREWKYSRVDIVLEEIAFRVICWVNESRVELLLLNLLERQLEV
jgi:hypothetical protein